MRPPNPLEGELRGRRLAVGDQHAARGEHHQDADDPGRPRIREHFPAGHALRRAQLAYRLAVDRAIQPAGVTSAQLQVLALVWAQPDISSAELARRSEVTPQTMKDIVRCLERSGLVERRADAAHGRILTLRLTAPGQAALDRCRALVDRVEEQMLAVFSAGERATFINLLVRAGDALTP